MYLQLAEEEKKKFLKNLGYKPPVVADADGRGPIGA
jgi:hypothetical protein